MNSKIKHISTYFPNKILENKDLKDIEPNWNADDFESKVGISRRNIVEEETALDLAEGAVKKMFEELKIDKEEIDGLILCTQSPEYFLPTTACILQNRLGLKTSTLAFDFNLGCSGYVYGLSIAKGLIAGGIAKKIILVTADTYSKFINEKDIINRAIFGDGASVTLIEKDEDAGIFDFVLGTDGSGAENLIVKNGGMKYKYNPQAEEQQYAKINSYTDNNLYMNGPEIFNFTIDSVPNLIRETLSKNQLGIDDIDWFVFHQANAFMLDYLRRKTKISKDKFYVNIKNTGNTVSSTIPIALRQMIDKGVLQLNQKVLLAGFGVGYSWGATVIKI